MRVTVSIHFSNYELQDPYQDKS